MHKSKHYLDLSESQGTLPGTGKEGLHETIDPKEHLNDNLSESVDELRERLNRMKKMMADRKPNDITQLPTRKDTSCVIDGNFLSVVFGFTLLLIVSVSGYAFYNLFVAIMKKRSRYHEEL
ncbi:uncharacterized protein [Euwallacea similis]|uniref:uncharacterized protein n=1 Tax=Euwallacea similis TaxID=1736056 RepID=UPI00344E6C67